jgi:hypothetical protein
MKNQNKRIEVELTNILLKEIENYCVKNEKRIDGSGMEIFCAVLNTLTVLMADSEYAPEPMIEFIQNKFPNAVRESRKLNKQKLKAQKNNDQTSVEQR